MKEVFGTREAADVLNLTPRRVRSLVQAGVVTPRREARGAFRFTFRDLVLLRIASGLIAGGISLRRVVRALSSLRRRLPRDRSLTELRIVADGETVLVYEDAGPWEAESGQFVLDFRVAELVSRVAPLRPARPEADDWFATGLDLEERDPSGAKLAYREVLAREPGHADAHVNLGRLLHEEGAADRAAAHYRSALTANPEHATAAFNLGVALEDGALWSEAARAYERSIAIQPDLADAWFNLASVRERLGDRQAALRALRQYRRLIDSPVAR